MATQFNLWAAGDAHIGTDLRNGRRSLAEAINQSEGRDPDAEGFDWDIMLDVGDLSGSQTPPDGEEGGEVMAQYAEMQTHRRAQVYNLAGNHDASGETEDTQWWFQRYGDPDGRNTRWSGVDPADRPFTVEGTWERYKFQVGNLLFLVMSDRNDGGPPVGRGVRGGYPAGAVTGETFDWWIEQVEANQHLNIISAHHHMLKETTVASGEWEGFQEKDKYGHRKAEFHGYMADGGPMGASYLYWVDGNPDAEAFERYLDANPGAIDLWIGGHTHAKTDEIVNGRSHLEERWGVTFLNCAALSVYHHPAHRIPFPAMSRLLTFTDGATEARIRCYRHTDVAGPKGFADDQERTFQLRHPFQAP
ncbi:MAG: metallophosphoesterase [Nitriliruptoraceae bacterium]